MAITSGAISLTSTTSSSVTLAGAVATGGSGTYTYQWLRSSDGGSTWSNISGATTATSVADTGLIQNNGYYYTLQSTDTVPNPDIIVTSNIVYAVTLGTPAAQSPISEGIPVESTTSIPTATSTVILAANSNRKYLLIQNNSAANIMVSLSGNTLTGIAPTSTNKGIVIVSGWSYEVPAEYLTISAITAYQTSGGTINTVTVVEG